MLSALPHLCAVISHPIAGYLADVFRNKKIISATLVKHIDKYLPPGTENCTG